MKYKQYIFLILILVQCIFTHIIFADWLSDFNNEVQQILPRANQLMQEWRTNFEESANYISKQELPIVVIIPSYNNKNWYEINLLSVFAQNYSNYRVMYIDDCSTDGTGELVENLVKKIKQENRTTIIHNKKRKGALHNLYHAIHMCPDEAIIVLLDGDDWFYTEMNKGNNVLRRVNSVYQDHNVLLTYGQMLAYPLGKVDGKGYCQQLPAKVIRNASYRTRSWCTSHLRTFYAGLFKKINKKDLQNEEGEFWPMAWDQALMFPMLEMAAGRIQFIPDILYVYNMMTPFNDNKVNAELQRECEKKIRSLPKYAPLKEDEVIEFLNKKRE